MNPEERLETALRSVEYIDGECPECLGRQGPPALSGHEPGCTIAEALGAETTNSRLLEARMDILTRLRRAAERLHYLPITNPHAIDVVIHHMDSDSSFGRWDADPGTIHVYIQENLPEEAQYFVLDHELFHVFDHETNWIKRELRANLYAARHNPKGFFIILWKTITSRKRLSYYWWRVRNGK